MSDATGRQQRILAIVQDQGFATIEALAEALSVSTQTARREAIRLQQAGLLQRFHGGVGLPGEWVRPGYALKRDAAPDAKRRIGVVAAALVPHGASVFIDVGTTTEAVARALADHGRLRVVTTSLHVAALLAGRPGIEVFVAGGTLRGADGSLVGVQTCATLARFRCDLALIGCSGFAEDGAATDHDLDKIAAKQAMLRSARQGILLADAAKFARAAPAVIAPAAAFGRLVTDAIPPAGIAAALAAQGTLTVLA